MPSGNATFTYIGDEPELHVSGETFTKDQPQTTHDNGVIGMIRGRKDFSEDSAFNGADTKAFDHDHDGRAGGSLTKAEVIADLDRLGIEYDARSSKAKLDALLREGKPACEAAVNASVASDAD